MSRIHFLNVKEGDCSVIQHNTGRVSVIDVCNAQPLTPDSRAITLSDSYASHAVGGNFGQKNHPVNPIEYFESRGISQIFRFVLTHPDMDHMDGLRFLMHKYRPPNFWDTANNKEVSDSDWESSHYSKNDWELYKTIRDGKPTRDPKRLTLYSGDNGMYWNEDPPNDGDGITILSPTPALVAEANQTGDYNDCSYVLLYYTGNYKIVFGGDSHDKTWNHILENHKSRVSDVDLLIAPHHGRDSGRSYEFLDVLKPKMTFFGNAKSEHLAYHAWNNRNLEFITNNQANCMIVNISQIAMSLYVTHENFARAKNPSTTYSPEIQGWYVKNV